MNVLSLVYPYKFDSFAQTNLITIMMKNLITCLLICLSFDAFSQDNAIKVNWTPFSFLGNFGLNYERKLADNFTINTRVNILAPRKMPFQGLFTDYFSFLTDGFDYENEYKNLSISSYGLHPQFRYFSEADALNGFYISGMLGFQYTSSSSIPYTFSDFNNMEYPGSVKINDVFVGVGIGVGNQWVTESGFTFDIMWIGLGIGSNQLKLVGKTDEANVTADAYMEVQDFIEENKTTFMANKLSVENDTYSITIRSRNILPYTKLLNFSIGYSF
jgi:hypothetical protein